MKLSEYLQMNGHGAISKLALQIGAHHPDVSKWGSRLRPIPIHRCISIERATDGAVTRQDLRPDDWMDIWPELVTEKAA